MNITPIDIQQQQFKTRPLGYDKAGVDRFLELIADELERLHKERQELREELSRSRAAVEEMREREATMKETLVTTQKMTDELKANARRESEIIIADAQLRAERIVRDADERRIQLIGEIQEIKRQKISFESSLRALVESHMRMLDLEVLQVEKGSDANLLEEPLPFEDGSADDDEGSPAERE